MSLRMTHRIMCFLLTVVRFFSIEGAISLHHTPRSLSLHCLSNECYHIRKHPLQTETPDKERGKPKREVLTISQGQPCFEVRSYRGASHLSDCSSVRRRLGAVQRITCQ